MQYLLCIGHVQAVDPPSVGGQVLRTLGKRDAEAGGGLLRAGPWVKFSPRVTTCSHPNNLTRQVMAPSWWWKSP